MPTLLAAPRRVFGKLYRRWFSAGPTSKTPDQDAQWQERLFRYYATNQPFASPLSMTNGNLTGETWEMREGYRQWTLTEPTLKAAVLTKCLAVCKLDPIVNPCRKDNPRDREAAEWVKWAIDSSEEGFPGILFNMLFPALTDGFSVVEKVWDKVPLQAGQYAGWWTLRTAPAIDTNFVRFRLNTFREIVAVQSMSGAQGGVPLDPRDFIIFTHLKIFDNPFGTSDIRAAVRACRLIEAAIRLRNILLTNYSGPMLLAKSKTPAGRASLMSVMDDAKANGWIVVDADTEMEVLNLASASNFTEFKEAIEFHQKDIVSAIQGSYLQLLEGGIQDGRGNTEVHEGVAQLYQWWLSRWVCQVLNRGLVPDLVIPNFGLDVGMPTISLGGIDEKAIKAAIEKFKGVQELNLPLSIDQVRAECRVEVPRDEADTLRPPDRGPQMGGGQGNATDPNDPFGGMFSERARAGNLWKGADVSASGTFPGGRAGADHRADAFADELLGG